MGYYICPVLDDPLFLTLTVVKKTCRYVTGFILCLVCYSTGALRNLLILYKERFINYIYDRDILNLGVMFSICLAVYALPKFAHSYYKVKHLKHLDLFFSGTTAFLVRFSLFSYFYPINEAKKQLVMNSKKKRSILEIAFNSGFNSKSVFNTYFKKFTGVTPREYSREYSRQQGAPRQGG
jgi:AraC-like DNA-binding protein